MGRAFVPHIITPDSAVGGSEIQRSVRFHNQDGTYLTASGFPTATSYRKFTFSTWVKHSNHMSHPFLLIGVQGTNPVHRETLTYSGSGDISYQLRSGGSAHTYRWATFATEAEYESDYGWLHVVFHFDSDNGTSSNRTIIYINGVQQDLYFYNNPQSGKNSFIQTSTFQIGRAIDVTSYDADGYMSETILTDGYLYDASYFGFTDSETGIWRPKSQKEILAGIGNWGNRGFYLNYADNSSTTALGRDVSGNGNHFAVNGMSVTDGFGGDSVTDTPTDNFCVMSGNHRHRDGTSVDDGGLVVSGSNSGESNIFGTHAVNQGKWYFEWKVLNSNIVKMGFVGVKFDINFNGGDVGIQPGQDALGIGMYYDSRDFLYGMDSSGSYYSSSASYTTDDIISCAFDADNNKFYFAKNNSWQNSGNPSNNTGGLTPDSQSGTRDPDGYDYYAPFFTGSNGGSVEVNFGQRAFTYTPPTGYRALNSKNIATPNPAGVRRPQRNFDVLTYSGDGGSAKKITGLEFKPDLIWFKCRSTSHNHDLYDSVRGNTKRLIPNSNTTESTYSNLVQSFNVDGMTIGTANEMNDNGENFIAFCWKAGGSSNTFNVDGKGYATAAEAGLSGGTGTITGASVNTEAGFSIIGYDTHADASDKTYYHGLKKKPQIIIAKSRTSSTSWGVYYTMNSVNTNFVQLESSNAQGNNTSGQTLGGVSGSYMYLHEDYFQPERGSYANSSNASGDAIAYLWHSVPGYSSFGVYQGNGNDNGPFIHMGFKPALVIFKKLSGSDNWEMQAQKQHTGDDNPNPVTKSLLPSSSNSEGSSRNNFFCSTGIKIDSSNGNYNESGYRYLYMAWAEKPGYLPSGFVQSNR